MLKVIFMILITGAIFGLVAGMTRLVIAGCVWFVIGLGVMHFFGAAIVGFLSTFGLVVSASVIPLVFAAIGIVYSLVKG